MLIAKALSCVLALSARCTSADGLEKDEYDEDDLKTAAEKGKRTAINFASRSLPFSA